MSFELRNFYSGILFTNSASGVYPHRSRLVPEVIFDDEPTKGKRENVFQLG